MMSDTPKPAAPGKRRFTATEMVKNVAVLDHAAFFIDHGETQCRLAEAADFFRAMAMAKART